MAAQQHRRSPVTNARDKLAELYPAHLNTLRDRCDAALEKTGFEHLVIFSGSERLKLFDDAPYPFVANPQFKAWAPLTAHPDCFIAYTPGEKPRLVYCQPDDYWYAPPAAPDGYWPGHFEVTVVKHAKDGLSMLPAKGKVAVIGEFAKPQLKPPVGELNPSALINNLDYHRAWKTAYEIECMRRANTVAARAHMAAEGAFRDGASELDIHLAYCLAAGQTESELPYSSIVALNEHGAILHYQNWSPARFARDELHSFLIDAGANYNGYAADVTRTYAASDTGFGELIERMDAAQLRLCTMLKPGVDYPAVHLAAHREIATILSAMSFVKLDPEAVFDAGITRSFFPHGVGHYIGLQVHDVGGFMADEAGEILPQPKEHPYLRLTRRVDQGHVMTIEPGLYFIDSLLEKLGDSRHARDIDWDRVDAFRKFGGVRIEDDVAITADGHENLTRDQFACV